MVQEDFPYKVGNTGKTITVPAGFVTDYASIPGIVRPIAERKNKRYQSAAVVHDWLYWIGYDRKKADDIFYNACIESGVRKLDAGLIWGGVRVGGQSAWDQNRKDRRAGYVRVIPEEYRDPNTWPDSWDGPRGLRKRLYNKGVR